MLRIRLKIDKSSLPEPENLEKKPITRRFDEAVADDKDEDDKYDTKKVVNEKEE